MLRIPLLENNKGLRFFGFLVSWFPGFKVSKFHGFKNLQCFQKLFVIYFQISISCLLVDIDLISQIFKHLLDGSAFFVGTSPFENCRTNGIRFFGSYEPRCLLKRSRHFLFFVTVRLWKRDGRELCRFFLLHFGLVTFRFADGRT